MKPTQEKDEFFIPLDQSVELETPESLSNDQNLPLLIDPSLSLKPLRFLSRAAKGILALITILAIWQTVEFFHFLSQTHWALAAVFGLLVAGLIGLLGKAAWEYFGYQKEFKGIDQLQSDAESILKARSCGHARTWLAKLTALYRNKPHQPLLEKALSTLPDYADDAETLQHLDQQLFRNLDKQAISRISRHSQQTAILVAISPLALLDILLSGWRCLKMLDEICQIYGLRPSLSARVRLLKMTLTQMALAGSTELITDQLADLASSKLISTISSQAATGAGIGFYTARIGILAMELCRPMPFTEGQRPGMGKMAKEIISSIRARFQKDSD
ncbi:TIGR01620 family protein [Endozoicomonas sp. 8E]|uniref:TIGR01620 family protein n=1 Tax=Endozoicomonas sp. 8E TaxID=3035692 RepID=UPI002939496F|nr:TIGR01620 family protein [Endozoicomonas sp. 8E]WOG26513.1 TIGR01620 family protein [Endozoicomonas sp. 8E]